MEANQKSKSSGMSGIFVILAGVVCVFGGTVFGQPWDGNGVEGDPYQIWTAEDMQAIGADSNCWDAHFKLMADIDLGSYTGDAFNIIGTYIDIPRNEAFRGVFDGDNHTISNFSTSPRANSTGVFGYISGVHAEVRNVGLVEPEVRGSVLYTGALVGLLGPGRVLGCWSQGGRVQGSNRTGGLVGKSSGGVICNSYSSSKVSGRDYTGGLVGYNGSHIQNCYATGSVSGYFYVGGLAGHAGHVLNSFSSGTVSGRTVGGLLGEKYGSDSVRNSFWDIESSGRTTSAGGTGLTTAEMQDMNTFLDAGWDFVGEYENGPSEDWAEPTGVGYPVLAWQVTPLPPLPAFSGGTGEANDPYLISTGSELNRIGHNPRLMAAHFKLVSDIDLSGATFFNIANIGYRFGGVFDGNGHTIRNFTHSVAHKDFVGLFACVSSNTARISNLALAGPNLYAPTEDYVGSLVGVLIRSSVTNCCLEGGQVEGHRYVGGLVGYNYEGLILECRASSQVLGEWGVGGLVGFNEGVVSESFGQGVVRGHTYTGGLIGSLDQGSLDNSYFVGSVSGNRMVGGLAGVGQDSNIVKCYAGASVTGNTNLGGLVGRDYRSSYTGCFWDSDVNPDVNGIGNRGDLGVISKTTAEMQTKSTFTDAGWDFITPIWTIDEGVDYPRLCWETNCSANTEPVACIVGGDRVVEAGVGCEARVVLDGSCSSDEDSTAGTNDDINDFDWYEVIDACDANSDIFLGTGEVIECNLGLGEHLIILEVTDKAGAFDTNEVMIAVEDVTPPEFSLSVEPNVLWPPNNKMMLVEPDWTVSDNCDELVEASLVDITMSAEGDVNDYVQIGGDGSIYLRARKGGGRAVRIYTLTYEAVDDSGNVAIDSAEVVVPHDLGRR